MAHRDREEKRGEERSRGKKSDQQADLMASIVEEVRTIDSEIDLLKQKMNLIIREINVLKHVILMEKKEIKELEDSKTEDKTRFEDLLRIVKEMKGDTS